MAGLSDTTMIDLVAEQADGTVLLAMIKEGRQWRLKSELPALKTKTNTYAQYILDGMFVNQYPNLAGRAVTICLYSSTPPPAEVIDALKTAASQLGSCGITVTHAISPRL